MCIAYRSAATVAQRARGSHEEPQSQEPGGAKGGRKDPQRRTRTNEPGGSQEKAASSQGRSQGEPGDQASTVLQPIQKWTCVDFSLEYYGKFDIGVGIQNSSSMKILAENSRNAEPDP